MINKKRITIISLIFAILAYFLIQTKELNKTKVSTNKIVNKVVEEKENSKQQTIQEKKIQPIVIKKEKKMEKTFKKFITLKSKRLEKLNPT
jgi:hypothetical protein